MKKLSIYILFTFLAACASNEIIDPTKPEPNPETGNEVALSFSFQDAAGTTRKINEEEENKIDSIRLYVFKDAGVAGQLDLDDEFLYDIKIDATTPITSTGTHEEIKTAYVTLKNPGGTQDKQRIIALANSPYVAMTPGEKVRKLLSEVKAVDGIDWRKPFDPNTKPIPMYGQTKDFRYVGPGKSPTYPDKTQPTTIDMIRAFARVDVIVDINDNTDDPALGNGAYFRVQRIHVFNISKSFSIAPDTLQLGKTLITKPYPTATDNSYAIDTASCIYDVGSSLNTGTSGGPNNKLPTFEGTIYLPERDSLKGFHSQSLPETATYLIIEALYYGQPYFYRVDFSSKGEYIPVLRNHHYKFVITGLRRQGYTDRQDAINFKPDPTQPADPPFTLDEAGDKKITEIKYIKGYYLGVSTTKLKLGNNHPIANDDQKRVAPKIFVKTDYPDGWKASVVAGSFELNKNGVSAGTTVQGTKGTVDSIFVKPLTNTSMAGAVEIGTVEITAGEIKQVIEIRRNPAHYTNMLSRDVDGTTPEIGLAGDIIAPIQFQSCELKKIYGSSADVVPTQTSIANANTKVSVNLQSDYGPTLFALIANSNDTLGSFMVWHVPKQERLNPPTHTFNGYEFMDRYLGIPYNSQAPQLELSPLFQWGRPNALFKDKLKAVNGQESIVNALQTPNVLYYNPAYPSDWNNSPNNTLWEAMDKEKGPYDPCPLGWRVPPSENTYLSPWNNFTDGNNGLSFIGNYKVPYGYDGATGISDQQSFPYVWSSSPGQGTLAKAYQMNTTTGDQTISRASAYAIRCVKDNIKRFY